MSIVKNPSKNKLLQRQMTTSKIDYKQLDGSLYCLSTYFNPTGSCTRKENFHVFHHRMMQQNANMLYGEFALHDRGFELSAIVREEQLPVKICGEHMLWQKENIINLLLQHLPDDCDKVCWVDSDILFQDEDWQANIYDALEQYRLVQCFDWGVMLPKGVEFIDNIETESFPTRFDDCSKVYGYIRGLLDPDIKQGNGFPGFAWAVRREVLEEMALYEECVLGGADLLMARASTYNHYEADICDLHSRFQLANYYPWAQKWCDIIDGSFSYTNGSIYHLFHGKVTSRNPEMRISLLKELQFDPSIDIEKNDEGAWIATSEGEHLIKPAQKFFSERLEDRI